MIGLFALALVVDEPSPLDTAVQQARSFLEAFKSEPRSAALLATQDALFATIDDRGPLAEVIGQMHGQDSFLARCSLGLVTARNVEYEAVQKLPAPSFKQKGPFFAVDASYRCSAPQGGTIKAKAQLILKDGKVAFFGMYPSREP